MANWLLEGFEKMARGMAAASKPKASEKLLPVPPRCEPPFRFLRRDLAATLPEHLYRHRAIAILEQADRNGFKTVSGGRRVSPLFGLGRCGDP